MEWSALISNERKAPLAVKDHLKRITNNTEINDYDYDYRRIIQSASFRRLQDKTQVFPLATEDFVRTRLTHSLEVSSIASSLGQHIINNIKVKFEVFYIPEMENIPQILSSAALIHDLGNPPFGHYGETVIKDWFNDNLNKFSVFGKPLYIPNSNTNILTNQQALDFINFDGNAQTFRIVNRLHFDRGNQGLNLTYAVLGAIGKYTVASDKIKDIEGDITANKIGYFYSEEKFRYKLSDALGTTINGRIKRHPLALVIEAADDIAYVLSDIEDTYKKGLVTLSDLIKFLNESLEYYIKENNLTGTTLKNVEYIVSSLVDKSSEGLIVDEYDIVNEWIFETQMYLINAANFSFGNNIKSIMEGTYNHDLFYGTYHETTMKILGDVAKEFAFKDPKVNMIELSSKSILEYFLDTYIPIIIKYDTDIKLSLTEKKLITVISSNYIENYKRVKEDLQKTLTDDELQEELVYHRIFIIVDFISGMTDSYSKDLYNNLKGIK